MAEEQKSGGGMGDLEKELSCSICTDVLYQPLTLLDCLHTFCGSCLKEWFSWQASSAAHQRRIINPYTCPSCRASVRETRPNATVTTLLEMFLKSHSEKDKSAEEKEETRKHYKPGDRVLPEVVGGEETDSEDDRLMDHVRDMSMNDVEPDRERRRIERLTRQRRRQDRTHLNSRPEELARQQQPSRFIAQQAQRHNVARGDRDVEHQASLRNLLNASEADSHGMQEDIMRQIMSEGLLDGIDLDNLTPRQEEELTERIAEAYRRRQRQRDRSRNQDRQRNSGHSPGSRLTNDNLEVRQEQEQLRRTSATSQRSQTRDRPPISTSHLFEQAAESIRRPQARSTSQTSTRSNRSVTRPDGMAAAARSATDLTERPRTGEAERERRRRLSSNARQTTDPANESTLAQVHRRRRSSGQQQAVGGSVRTQNNSLHPVEVVRRHSGPTNTSSPSLTTPTSDSYLQANHTVRPATSSAAFAPEVTAASTTLSAVGPPAFQEPSIICSRCNKTKIQYDLHYHCSRCANGAFDICLKCYRAGAGCLNWFGFGYSAKMAYQRSLGTPTNMREQPHILSPRRYQRPPTSPDSAIDSMTLYTDPNSRLDEGPFCDSCFAFARSCYWYCDICLNGAWGFCNKCVQKGKHCTHALLPIAHLSAAKPAYLDAAHTLFFPMWHMPQDTYVLLPVFTHCDVCRNPIAPSSTRYHCYECSEGDYDVCSSCYRSLVTLGRISQADGPNGWRRCLQGHRMAVIGFEDREGGQRRVVVQDRVGGCALKEDEVAPVQHSQDVPAFLPPDGGVGGRALALWSRFPPPVVEDELAFPKNAEVREIEDVNEDWCWGVYAGGVKLFPRNHVRML